MRFPFAAALASACLISAPAMAQGKDEPQRQLGAHVHGAGKLDIAFERRTVEMEIEAPANDIVGFESTPTTPEQKQAVAQARATLSKPLGLIKLPEAAGCKVASASVKLVGGGAHNHGHDHGKAKSGGTKAAETHSEFHAEYKFSCAKPELIRTIELDYFKAFPRAEKLDVTIVGERLQAKAVATKDKPSFEIKR